MKIGLIVVLALVIFIFFSTRNSGSKEEFEEKKKVSKEKLEELKKEPINIDLLKRSVAEAEESLEIYESEVNNILTDIELIEKLIRYANRYRKDNIEFHQQLTVAEQYYREYRYNKTLEIIRNALDKVEPGAYERIRNSIKAN